MIQTYFSPLKPRYVNIWLWVIPFTVWKKSCVECRNSRKYLSFFLTSGLGLAFKINPYLNRLGLEHHPKKFVIYSNLLRRMLNILKLYPSVCQKRIFRNSFCTKWSREILAFKQWSNIIVNILLLMNYNKIKSIKDSK